MRGLFAVGCLVWIVSGTITAQESAPDAAGVVAKVTGNVQTLRHPRDTPKEARANAPDQAKYDGKFWDAVDLAQGAPVLYGDVLSASAQGKTQLTLDCGFNVILAPNAKLKVTRLVAGERDSETVLELMIGAMRRT